MKREFALLCAESDGDKPMAGAFVDALDPSIDPLFNG